MKWLLQYYPGDGFFQVAASALVQTAFVVLVGLVLSRFFLWRRAALRHAVWMCVLVCALASPFTALAWRLTGFSLVEIPVAGAEQPPPMDYEVAGTGTSAAESAESVPVAEELAEAPAAAAQSPQGQAEPAASGQTVRAILAALFGVWLAGVVFHTLRLIYGFGVHAALRRAVQPIEAGDFEDVLSQVRSTVGVKILPPIVTSSVINSPVSIGIFNPLVILPTYLPYSLEKEELRDVLVHEVAHVVQRDHVVGLIQRLAGILLWPHPLLRVLNRELATAREEVCDNFVLGATQAPSYARILLGLAEKTTIFHRTPASVGLAHPRWKLEDRVAGILDEGRTLRTRAGAAAFAGVIAAFVLAVAVSAACSVVTAGPLQQARSLEQLVEELQSDDAAAGEMAVRQLIAAGRPAAEAVEKLLASEDDDLKARAAKVMSALHYVTRPDRQTIEGKIRLCAGIRDAKSLDEQLEKSAAAVRKIPHHAYFLVEVLARRGESDSEEAAARLLRHTAGLMSRIRDVDTILLGKKGGGHTVVKVAADGQGKPVVLEAGLAQLLRAEMPPDGVLAFLACDGTVETALRVESLKALASRGAKQAVEVLVSLLGRSKGAMLVETAATLRELTGQGFGPVQNSTVKQIESALGRWNAWWNANGNKTEYRFGD
jgi:beta-lactamase regulating signal transducer with metallopeptidase domain